MQLAPAILWSLFVGMGSFMHLIYFLQHKAKITSLLHLSYDIIVYIISNMISDIISDLIYVIISDLISDIFSVISYDIVSHV